MKQVLFIAAMMSCLGSFAQTSGKRTPATVGYSKVAYVDIDTLEAKCELLQKKRAELSKQKDDMEAELGRMFKKLQTEADEAERKANSDKLSQADYEKTQKRLEQMHNDFETRKQEFAEKAVKDQEEINNLLRTELNTFLEDYNKTWHFDCILSYSWSDPSVLFINKQLDITSDVVAGMNSMGGHAVKKKK